MNKPEIDPLSRIVGEIAAGQRGLPLVTVPWLAAEALRRLSPKDRDAALEAAARQAAVAALSGESYGVTCRRYPVSRDGETQYVLHDCLSAGEAIDLAHQLRAQAAAAEAHADVIEVWRRHRWPELTAEGVQ
jgi:hypothetical protein